MRRLSLLVLYSALRGLPLMQLLQFSPLTKNYHLIRLVVIQFDLLLLTLTLILSFKTHGDFNSLCIRGGEGRGFNY